MSSENTNLEIYRVKPSYTLAIISCLKEFATLGEKEKFTDTNDGVNAFFNEKLDSASY